MKSLPAWAALAAVLTGLGPRIARAQGDTSVVRPVVADSTTTAARAAMDSAFARARRLVMSGQTAAGRQIGDSVLAATREGTEAYGEALYGLATLAPTAADAQVDYQRIIVEYPLSAHAGDALLQMAQMERSLGDRSAAIAHLQRFLRENPTSPSRARTGLWLAQLLFEQNDDVRGCGVLSTARSAANPSDVELQNQMNFYSRRCAAVAAQAAADSTARADSISADSVARAEALKHGARKREPAAKAPPAAARKTPASAEHGPYAVQLAAYGAKADAQALVRALHARGVEARVDGDRKPFRVWVGHYQTRAQAETAIGEFKKIGYTGFVTRTDGR